VQLHAAHQRLARRRHDQALATSVAVCQVALARLRFRVLPAPKEPVFEVRFLNQ